MTDLAAPLPAVEARFGDGHYGIFDQGAQVFAWCPAGAVHDVLWLSSASAYVPGRAIRGGVPICFPWFGPGASGDRSPAHGFVRTVGWRRQDVDNSIDTDGRLRVEYVLDQSDTGEQPQFPHAYAARLVARFAPDRLEVELTAENTGDEPFGIEEALHTYLQVSDVTTVRLDGLDGLAYLDKVAGDSTFDRVQDGGLTLDGPTDRVYLGSPEVTVADPGFDRVLRVGSSGASNVVVWNPWSDGADRMADMGPGEWRRMLCVEAANAFADAVTLLPGESWTISQRIDLERPADATGSDQSASTRW